jgi:streptomycin 6-kinase
VDAAVEFLTVLPPTQPESVLVHQDLHGGNVLAAQREPWLAIDPKPVAGERAFALAPVVRSAELGHARAAVHRRLDHLAAETGVDRERARGWAVGQTLAWAFADDGGALPHHVDVARWLLEG